MNENKKRNPRPTLREPLDHEGRIGILEALAKYQAEQIKFLYDEIKKIKGN